MEKDFSSNVFFSDNSRYADIINGIGCGGIPFVKGDDLQELDTRVNFGRLAGLRRRRNKKILSRDLLRKTPFGVNFAIIGIENQEEIDYALALRVMSYDAGEYERQAARIRKETRKKREGLSPGERLYGFRKGSRLFPTVTFVLYFGEEDWDGSRDIHGLLDFTDIPGELKSKVSNYKVHIVQVRKLENTDLFKTDVKQVFDFIRYSKDKEKLKELMEKGAAYTSLDEDAYDMVAAYVGEGKMLKLKEKNKNKKTGKVDICQGLREWIEEEKIEGKREGRIEGKREGIIEGEERFAALAGSLIKDGRPEDLMKALEDKEYREQLYLRYKI